MSKRSKIRRSRTPFDIKAKKLSRQLSQYKKHPVYYTTWAGFLCPNCHQTSTEEHGFAFGGCALKCYHCNFYTEFNSMKQFRRAIHSRLIKK